MKAPPTVQQPSQPARNSRANPGVSPVKSYRMAKTSPTAQPIIQKPEKSTRSQFFFAGIATSRPEAVSVAVERPLETGTVDMNLPLGHIERHGRAIRPTICVCTAIKRRSGMDAGFTGQVAHG